MSEATIAITGGIGGPAVSMFVWPAGYGHGMGNCIDYGWGYWHNGPVAGPGTVLWSTTSTAFDTATGTAFHRICRCCCAACLFNFLRRLRVTGYTP